MQFRAGSSVLPYVRGRGADKTSVSAKVWARTHKPAWPAVFQGADSSDASTSRNRQRLVFDALQGLSVFHRVSEGPQVPGLSRASTDVRQAWSTPSNVQSSNFYSWHPFVLR